MEGMPTMHNQGSQQVLQTSFLLCNGNSNVVGRPVEYASPGFLELFQYGAKECAGKRCGELVGGLSIISCGTNISSAAEALNLAPSKLEDSIAFLMRHAANESVLSMMNPGKKVGYTLSLSRKKGGEVFVCEGVMLVLTHPNDSKYVLSLQRDVSSTVSVEMLLDAIVTDSFTDFMKNQEKSLRSGAPDADMDLYMQAANHALPPETKLLLDELLESTATQEHEAGQAWPEEHPSGPDEALEKQKPPFCLQKQLRKTKLCVYHLNGGCKFAASCNFAHTMTELLPVPDLRNTQLCKMFIAGACHDEHCKFAHTRRDIRNTGMFYKHALCTWYKRGLCRNGTNCRFAHGPNELKADENSSADFSPDAKGSDLIGGSKGSGKGVMGGEEPRWNRDKFGSDADWGYPQQPARQQPQQQLPTFLEDPMYIQPHGSPQHNQESNHVLKQALESMIQEYGDKMQWLDAAAQTLSPAEAAAPKWAGPSMSAGPASTASKATDMSVRDISDQIKTLIQHVERLEMQIHQRGSSPACLLPPASAFEQPKKPFVGPPGFFRAEQAIIMAPVPPTVAPSRGR